MNKLLYITNNSSVMKFKKSRAHLATMQMFAHRSGTVTFFTDVTVP